MRRGFERAPDLAARITGFLRLRGEPASSHMLAERFLKTAVVSESLATTLLRQLLEPAGAVYREGAGWVAGRSESVECVAPRFVGAAIDHASGRITLADEAGAEPGDLAGATVVVLDPARDAPALRSWLVERRRSRPASIVSLRRATRGVARVPRAAELSDFCGALGVRWLDSEDARGVARAMAACAAAGVSRRAPAGTGDEERRPPRLPEGITEETLASLPQAPGVYRFYDKDGALIYVGKAVDLRRRVSSYFTTAAMRRPRRFYSRIGRLEYDVVGSELEALLKEARAIARRAPPGNVQVEVHERGRSYLAARSWALLLPRRDGRGVMAIILTDGRYLGQFTIGPRGGGSAEARRVLGRAARWRRKDAVPPGVTDRDSEILRSWLARHAESVSRLELDSFRNGSEASRALRLAARQLMREQGPVVFR